MIDRGYGRIVNVLLGWGCFSENMKGFLVYVVSKVVLNVLMFKFVNYIFDNIDVIINVMSFGWVYI